MTGIIITNWMYTIFPILLYFVGVAYNKMIDGVNNRLLLELSLYISFFFILCLGGSIYTFKPFYLLNIPILLAYMKKRNSVAIIMSIISIIYIYNILNINIFLIISNFFICFLIYKFYKDKLVLLFSITNIIYTYFYIGLNPYATFIIMIYIITIYMVTNLVSYMDKTMNLYMSLKDIENNKQLQDSLFKISHEIKNPIAVCKGYLELMDGTKKKYDKYVPIISEEINHSLSILKDFSQIGKLTINLELMDINMLLEEIIDNYKPILEQKDIILETNLIDDEIYVMGDYIRLKEVIINIIKNAMEAITDEGEIRIVEEKTHNKVFIHFIDDGCGIKEDEIQKVGVPFFTTKVNGTGLGTYLSKEIIKEHNGKMEYFSKVGAGTQVLIRLNTKEI